MMMMCATPETVTTEKNATKLKNSFLPSFVRWFQVFICLLGIKANQQNVAQKQVRRLNSAGVNGELQMMENLFCCCFLLYKGIKYLP